MHPPAEQAAAVIESAVAKFRAAQVVALFSGGHDSLTATALAALHPRFAGAVHVNTGVGVEETREFVRETCREQGWPLVELHAQPRQPGRRAPGTYEEMVLKFGFPGPATHYVAYRTLKERQLARYRAELKAAGLWPTVFVTGIRREESKRRMRTMTEHWEKRAGFFWANPLLDWTKSDCHKLMESYRLRRNQVVDLLHMSGECLCGAFAAADEMRELERWFPDTAAYLHKLERRVETTGTPHCVWGSRPDLVHPDQARLFSVLPLCTSCTIRDARITSLLYVERELPEVLVRPDRFT